MSIFEAKDSRNALLCARSLTTEIAAITRELQAICINGKAIEAMTKHGIATYELLSSEPHGIERYQALRTRSGVTVTALGSTQSDVAIDTIKSMMQRVPVESEGVFRVLDHGGVAYESGNISPMYVKLLKWEKSPTKTHSLETILQVAQNAITTGTTIVILNETYPVSPIVLTAAIKHLRTQKVSASS